MSPHSHTPDLNALAFSATIHCLTGCAIGEVLGMVIGTALGAAILGMAAIGIILSQWDSNWVYTFQGVILVLAVMLNAAIRSRAGRARGR